MKKIKIIYLFIFFFLLVGCMGEKNIEIFRFVNLENEIHVGESVNLQILLGQYPEDSKITYTLSQKDVIEFEDGVATGVKAGEVDVRATVDNKVFATTKVIVKKVEVDGLQILSTTNIVLVNESIQLDTRVFPDSFSKAVKWSIEKVNGEDNDAAEISTSGLLTGKYGERDEDEYAEGGVRVRVVATLLEDEKIVAKKDFYIRHHETTILSLTAPEDKTEFLFTELEGVESIQLLIGKLPVDSYPIVSFTSSDEGIVLVDINGVLTFPETLKEGTSTITVTTMDGKTDTLEIELIKPEEPEE